MRNGLGSLDTDLVRSEIEQHHIGLSTETLSERLGAGIANDVILELEVLEATVAHERRSQDLSAFLTEFVSVEVE